MAESPETRRPHDPVLDSGTGPIPIEPEEVGAAGKGHLDEPGLLEEFDEDADFDRDPDVDRAIQGDLPPPAAFAGPIDDRPIFVKAGWDDPKLMAGFGGGLAVAAVVASSITAPEGARPWLAALLTLYGVALHTGTGIVAVILAAVFTQRVVGRYAQTAARMFVAVSIFALAFHINILTRSKTEEILLATLAYVGVVAGTFRLKRDPLVVVCGSHFVLWLFTWIGMWLSQLAAAPVAE
jgi:hypothetical protein